MRRSGLPGGKTRSTLPMSPSGIKLPHVWHGHFTPRLDQTEAGWIHSLAIEAGCDDNDLVSSLLRQGMSQARLDRAIHAYKNGAATLSLAAGQTGLSQRDFIQLLEREQVGLNYDSTEFASDLTELR